MVGIKKLEEMLAGRSWHSSLVYGVHAGCWVLALVYSVSSKCTGIFVDLQSFPAASVYLWKQRKPKHEFPACHAFLYPRCHQLALACSIELMDSRQHGICKSLEQIHLKAMDLSPRVSSYSLSQTSKSGSHASSMEFDFPRDDL